MSEMFTPCDTRYEVDGDALRIARERRDITQKRFAYLCGWSSTYQWKLERGHVSTICQDTVDLINKALVTKE